MSKKLGNNYKLSDSSALGNCYTLGEDCTIGECVTLGSYNDVGYNCTIGFNATIGNYNTFGRHCTFGNWSRLGHDNKIGDQCTLGDDCVLGEGNALGYGFSFGKRLMMAGCRVLALMCMSNVDGSGRNITIIVHTGGIKIEAGCFSDTLDAFCEKAMSEGKTRYARVVRAAAEALQADVVEKGITGGWDEGEDSMNTIQIKYRYTGSVAEKKDLCNANLSSVGVYGAYLDGAYLEEAQAAANILKKGFRQ